MSPSTVSRRSASVLTALAVGLVAALVPATAAVAAEGPSPRPDGFRVIAGVHTDAVSTFLDEGRLALASKADVEEGNGTRFVAEDVWFHVADDAKQAVPGGFDFISPVGRQVWIAPESNPGPGKLWPGFSTESVPAGAIAGNETTFTMTGFEGPGELEVFTGGGLGGVKRLWSSDEPGFESFTVGRTHMHANWAFTAPGTYELGVRSTVTLDGQQQSADATYTFVVGPLAAPTSTTTTLTPASTAVVAGAPLRLGADIAPADAAGWVEFSEGDTLLGHAAVTNGKASLDVTKLPLGQRSLTARFVPELPNHFAASDSAAVSVTVTEEADGDVFGIYSAKDRYAPGDSIVLEVRGFTPTEGERYMWRWWTGNQPTATYRTINSGFHDPANPLTTSVGFEASQGMNGARVEVLVLPAGSRAPLQAIVKDEYLISVDGYGTSTGEDITFTGIQDEYYIGDVAEIEVHHRALNDGETVRWMSRGTGTTGWRGLTVDGTGTTYRVPTTTGYFLDRELAYEILDAQQIVIGRSPIVQPRVLARDVTITDLLGIYREGQTIQAKASVYPPLDGVEFQWGVNMQADPTALDPVAGATDQVFGQAAQLAWHNRSINVQALDPVTGGRIGVGQATLLVTDADPSERMLVLGGLGSHGDHYHSYDPIELKVAPYPDAASTDTFRWFWMLPGETEWAPIPGGDVAEFHGLRGEQALHGAKVRAEHRDENGALLAASAEGTIKIDDHGLPAPQRLAVHGMAPEYAAGEGVELTVAVTSSVTPATILPGRQWFVRLPGQSAPTPIEGATGATYGFTAGAAWNGAEITSTVVRGDGKVVYGPSNPVTLKVVGGDPTGPVDPPDPSDPTDPTDPADPTDPTDPADPTDPVTPAPSEKPVSAPAGRDGSDLTSAPSSGLVTTSDLRAGQEVTLRPGEQYAGQWVAAWMFSTPTLLGGDWLQVSAAGELVVRLPADAPAGAHRIAVYAADGSLVAWSEVTVAATGATPVAAAGPAGALAVTGGGLGLGWLAVALVVAGAGVTAGGVLLRRRQAV